MMRLFVEETRSESRPSGAADIRRQIVVTTLAGPWRWFAIAAGPGLFAMSAALEPQLPSNGSKSFTGIVALFAFTALVAWVGAMIWALMHRPIALEAVRFGAISSVLLLIVCAIGNGNQQFHLWWIGEVTAASFLGITATRGLGSIRVTSDSRPPDIAPRSVRIHSPVLTA